MALNTMQGLTPTIIVRVPQTIDLTEASNHYVSIKQNDCLVLKKSEGFIVEQHEVEIYLTQEETLRFRTGTIFLQLNWTYATGQRGATRWIGIRVEPNQLLEVLP